MWLSNDSLVCFLIPLSSMSSDKSLILELIFSDSFEYFPRSLINKIIIKTNIGNMTKDVVVYACKNSS